MYELSVTPDPDSDCDPERARRVLFLAETIVKSPKRIGLLLYNDEYYDRRAIEGVEGVQVVFVRDGLRYTILVSDDAHSGTDDLAVWVREDGTSADDALTSLSDYGLDGLVNYGSGANIPRFMRNVPREAEEGLEHEATYQELYETALNHIEQLYGATREETGASSEDADPCAPVDHHEGG